MTGAAQPDALDRLHPALVHHLVNTLGWRSLRPLQRIVVDPLLAGEDALRAMLESLIAGERDGEVVDARLGLDDDLV